MEPQANLSPQERPIRVTELDTILPSQYFATRRKQAPEERLMIAILHDAIDCVQKYRFATDTHRRRLFREAKQWVLANEANWPYSFECICGVLDLDSIAVRQRLRVAPEPQTSPPASTNRYRQGKKPRSHWHQRQR